MGWLVVAVVVEAFAEWISAIMGTVITPVIQLTGHGTRAMRGRQVVSVNALRLGRARGCKFTTGSTVKREVVWYLVQWKGYAEEHNLWVKAEDMHAPDAIREYEEAQQRGDDLGVHYLHCN